MLFTILAINELVRRKIHTEEFILDGKKEIKGIRCAIPDCIADEGYAYVGSPEYFGLNIQLLSVLYYKGDYIAANVPTSDLLNEALDAGEQLCDFEKQLREAILAEQPFQAITEVVYKVSHDYIYIHNNFFHVLGIVGESSGESFQYMKENKATSPFLLRRIIREKDFRFFMNGHEIQVFDLPAYAQFSAQIRVNCFFHDTAMCRISIPVADVNVSPGILYLAECIGHIVEQIPYSKAQPFFEADILDGSDLLKNTFDPEGELVRPMVCRLQNRPFYLYRFDMENPVDNTCLYYWLCLHLENLFSSSYAFMHKNSAVLVVPESPKLEEKISFFLPDLLRETGFFCTVSNRGKNIRAMADCFRQTEGLREIGTERYPGVYYFEDCAVEQFLREISAMKDFNPWIHKNIEKLIDYDQSKKTQNYATLLCLVKNDFTLNETARELFIHRNSLQYRLERIQEILECDFDDSNTRFYISLSCRLYEAQRKSKF